ncbi:MAG: FAD-dependent oxidoreductase, partial [Candidatus Izemoplasmatales bacterium]
MTRKKQKCLLVKLRENIMIKDIVVIGGGASGLAASISAKKRGKNVLLIEREKELGG